MHVLKIGSKFIQDDFLLCEVVKIYFLSKNRVKTKYIDITKNGKLFTYEFDCFNKSFNKSIELKTNSFKILN